MQTETDGCSLKAVVVAAAVAGTRRCLPPLPLQHREQSRHRRRRRQRLQEKEEEDEVVGGGGPAPAGIVLGP